MGGARTPEELETLLEDAFVLRDPEALARLFEAGAMLVVGGGPREARGHREIARAATRTWNLKRSYLAGPERVLQVRDTALILGRRAVNLVRRGDDGSWLYTIAVLDLQTRGRVGVAAPPRAYAGTVTSADIADVLRARGHRVTRPRRAVWEALVGASGHLTVEELAGRVREREPGVNLASVYRSLALFEEFDLVRESRLGDDEAGRWEVAHPDDHFHVVCEECGEVDHHVGDLVERLRDHLETGHGFHTRSVDMTVTGRCARCAGSP